MKPQWTAADQLHGLREGWILTNDSGDMLCIAKVDDPLAWPEHECGLLDYDEPKFTCDEEAQAFVERSAQDGSEVARKALSFVGKPAL